MKKRGRRKVWFYLTKRNKKIVKHYLANNMRPKDSFTWVEALKEFKHVGTLESSDKLFKCSKDILDPMNLTDINLLRGMIPTAYINVALSIIRFIIMTKKGMIKKKHTMLLRDEYIYPALFCFRLYLELKIKDSIQSFSEKSKVGEVIQYPTTHNLSSLWNVLSPHIEDKDNDYNIITSLIEEFQKYDAKSVRFRYPFGSTTITGKNDKIIEKHPDCNIDLIDVENLYELMLKIYQYIEKINLKANKQ